MRLYLLLVMALGVLIALGYAMFFYGRAKDEYEEALGERDRLLSELDRLKKETAENIEETNRLRLRRR